LVAVTFRSLRAGVILGAMGRALRSGTLPPSSAVDVQTDLTELSVTAPTPFPYQVDGDHLGDTRRLAFRHEPDVLSLVVP
jgi:hypothetical protein